MKRYVSSYFVFSSEPRQILGSASEPIAPASSDLTWSCQQSEPTLTPKGPASNFQTTHNHVVDLALEGAGGRTRGAIGRRTGANGQRPARPGAGTGRVRGEGARSVAPDCKWLVASPCSFFCCSDLRVPGCWLATTVYSFCLPRLSTTLPQIYT